MSAIEQNDDGPSVDELFKIVMIDRKRKVRLTIQLRDLDGDEVPIREAIESLTEYVSDKLKDDDENSCKQQIMPLMAQSMVGGLNKLMGPGFTGMMLAQEHVRYGLIHMMTVSFYLLKWIQQKNIKIHTIEHQLTEADVDTYERVSKASNAAMLAAMMGHDSKEMIREMLKAGKIKKSDLEMLGASDLEDTEVEAPEEDDGSNGAN